MRRPSLVFATFLISSLAIQAWATDYYVSWDTGTDPATCANNDNGCGSEGSPCKTISCALAEADLETSGPHVLHVAPGTYHDQFTVGTSDENSTIICDCVTCNPDEPECIIDGTDTSPLNDSLAKACTGVDSGSTANCTIGGNAANATGVYVFENLGARTINASIEMNYPSLADPIRVDDCAVMYAAKCSGGSNAGGTCDANADCPGGYCKAYCGNTCGTQISSSSDVDCSGERGVQFDIIYPHRHYSVTGLGGVTQNGVTSGQCGTLANCLKLIEGSFYWDSAGNRNGDGTVGDLYVHTWKSDAPTNGNVETLSRTASSGNLITISGNGVTLDGFSVRYAGTVSGNGGRAVSVSGDNVIVQNVYGRSVDNGIIFNSTADNPTLINATVTHTIGRSNLVTNYGNAVCSGGSNDGLLCANDLACPGGGTCQGQFCFGRTCGWYYNAGGTGIGTSGSSSASGAYFRHITNSVCYNGVVIEGHRDAVPPNDGFYDIFTHSCVKHPFDIQANATCTNLYFNGIVAFNAEDTGYTTTCTSEKLIRSLPYYNFTASSTSGRLRGFLGTGLRVSTNSQDGFTAAYNAYPSGAQCKIESTNHACDGDIWTSFAGELNSLFGEFITLGCGTWPCALEGITSSLYTRADFYPVAGSATIDTGDPDIDGDGDPTETDCSPVREDDCCDEANHCLGAAPDIGPFEYGLDPPIPSCPFGNSCYNGQLESCGGTCVGTGTLTILDSGLNTCVLDGEILPACAAGKTYQYYRRACQCNLGGGSCLGYDMHYYECEP